MEKWDPGNPNCAFKHYFYNKVDAARVPFYQPGPNEDPREWEEALQNKPGDEYIPVLCAGFAAMAERLKTQRRAVAEFNSRVHEVNGCLDALLARHDLDTAVRALAARRRHAQLQRRSLALAARVQVLKNRGYALSGDEDDLLRKLQAVERGVEDPALSARTEELWSRLITLRGYANSLQAEVDKRGLTEAEGLGEDVEAKAKKVSWLYSLSSRGLLPSILGYNVYPLTCYPPLIDSGGLRETVAAPEEGGGACEEGPRGLGGR
jgi:nuclear pore complex protein Nup54